MHYEKNGVWKDSIQLIHIFKKPYINLFSITLLDIRFFLKIFSASFSSIVSPLTIISLDDRDRIVIAFLLANRASSWRLTDMCDEKRALIIHCGIIKIIIKKLRIDGTFLCLEIEVRESIFPTWKIIDSKIKVGQLVRRILIHFHQHTFHK